MALDRRLSANFWLHEFTGWERATEAQVRELEETVARVLQPIRNRFGKVIPTSWIAWSSGELRDGSHAEGGTVDFIVGDSGELTREAFEWGARYLIPAGYIGRWIYEPARAADPARGVRRQGEHIHMAPVRAMVASIGDARIQVLEELEEGQYVFFRTAALGLGALIAGAVAFFLLARHRAVALT